MATDIIYQFFDQIMFLFGIVFIIAVSIFWYRLWCYLFIGNVKYTYRLRYKHPDCKINFKEGTYNYFWTAKIAKKIYQANYPNRKYWISKSEKY